MNLLRDIAIFIACVVLKVLAEVFSTLHILAYAVYAGLDALRLWLNRI